MLKKFVLGGMVVVAALLGNACGDDGSGDSPAGPADGDVPLSSSSDDVVSSSSEKNEAISSSYLSSSSSKKAVGSSSSSNEKSSSSSGNVESSSSGKGEKSSSSKKVESSSSSKAEVSSSSAKTEESSSSSVKTSSSSQKSSSSSAKSSSSKPKSSSSSAKSSSSSAKSSSSTVVIPSKLYDCEEYKCVTTKYLNPEIEYGEYLDVRDTQVYRTVQIGEQVWMAQNLNYKSDTLSSCFDLKDSNCTQWGRLYTWEKALTVCPDGWHLPDTSEYRILVDYANEHRGDIKLGESLESLETGKYDIFGFSILLGSGYRKGTRYFTQGGKTDGDAFFWTASETDGKEATLPPEEYALARCLRNNKSMYGNVLGVMAFEKEDWLSVRCLKD
ncbi:FISUMP domain-containing protein [uncultured Fibrobacter sp.]|uniref:FISUMP domain-containing protein n=1 Tax=uncultured Fibrobacter sp. TaxID=261512 RepID=UPI0025F5D31F|nr:FISUMP domain-containing protein [uncultured Fibrobacter sp.]